MVEDVHIEMQQALNMVSIYSNILTGSMEAFGSIISNNLNLIMKRMTSITIILQVPTLIASLYGMNVSLPIDDKAWAFVAILLLSIALSCAAFFVFKKSNGSNPPFPRNKKSPAKPPKAPAGDFSFSHPPTIIALFFINAINGKELNLSKSELDNLSCITRYFSNSDSAKLFANSAETTPASSNTTSPPASRITGE